MARLNEAEVAAGLNTLSGWTAEGGEIAKTYAFGDFVDSIWKSQPWSNTLRAVFDGLLYALVTAGVFGWLWPD